MKIVKYPHPALRVRAKPLAAIDADVQKAAGEMLELMYRSEGLGLAAPQVALDYQLIVMNFVGEHDRPDQQVVALNPVIKFTTLFGLLAVELAVKLTADAGAGISLMLSAVFFVLSLIFVYRSFYGMRIGGTNS